MTNYNINNNYVRLKDYPRKYAIEIISRNKETKYSADSLISCITYNKLYNAFWCANFIFYILWLYLFLGFRK